MKVVPQNRQYKLGDEAEELLSDGFGLGWASSDEAHLPELPRVLAKLIGAERLSLSVVNWDGTVIAEYTHPSGEEAEVEGERPMVAEGDLYEELYTVENEVGVRIRAEAPAGAGFSVTQLARLDRAKVLIRRALECIFVDQRNPEELGEAFADLSGREWDVCKALDGPEGEKAIAEQMNCSRHTVHSYVKSLYRKMGVRSRYEVTSALAKARGEVRRRATDSFLATEKSREKELRGVAQSN